MLDDIAAKYLANYPSERSSLGLLLRQLADGDVMNDRRNFRGHATGGAIVLSPDRRRVLMIHHKFLNLWLQPGGHMDPDETDPCVAAWREAIEETGVDIAQRITLRGDLAGPVQISTHAVPANPAKDEFAHYHHDFRYVFLSASEALRPELREIVSAEWVAFDDARTAELDVALSRLCQLGVID